MTLIKALAILSFMLTACVQVPFPTNETVEPPAWELQAASYVRYEWSVRLNVELGDIPTIVWFEGDCLDYTHREGIGGCLTGVYWTADYDDTEIHLIKKDKPSQTALAHELLHWALDVRGDSDNDHLGPEWLQVAEVEATL